MYLLTLKELNIVFCSRYHALYLESGWSRTCEFSVFRVSRKVKGVFRVSIKWAICMVWIRGSTSLVYLACKKISLRYKIGDKFVRKNKESTKDDLPDINKLTAMKSHMPFSHSTLYRNLWNISNICPSEFNPLRRTAGYLNPRMLNCLARSHTFS